MLGLGLFTAGVLSSLLWLHVETHFNVELAEVCAVLANSEGTVHDVAHVDTQWLLQVEDTLLPMRIRLVRRCGQRYWVF